MKRLALQIVAVVGSWSVLALIWAVNLHAWRVLRGYPDSLKSRLYESLLDYWIYAALTALVFWAAKRFRFQRGRVAVALFAHAGCFVVFSGLHLWASHFLGITSATVTIGLSPLRELLLNLNNDLWMYGPLVVVWNLLDYHRRYRERDLITARLQAQLAQAQLDLLKAQIHPHFLFNTLNSISSLMHEDANAADDMLADLSYMLRQSLDIPAGQEISLQHELDLLEAYVRIQKRRFEERLSVTIAVTPGIREALVPAFLCQPLVENAIRHGIGERAQGGVISVAGFRRDNSIVLEVRDSGRGLPANYREGIGLSNIRKRLEQLYGSRQSITLEGNRDGGVTVTLQLPFRAGALLAVGDHRD